MTTLEEKIAEAADEYSKVKVIAEKAWSGIYDELVKHLQHGLLVNQQMAVLSFVLAQILELTYESSAILPGKTREKAGAALIEFLTKSVERFVELPDEERQWYLGLRDFSRLQ